MVQIVIGSMNPTKIESVRQAVEQLMPDATIKGALVNSGVAEQPYGQERTKQGAINRATVAMQMFQSDDTIAIGFEGGIDDGYLIEWGAIAWKVGRQIKVEAVGGLQIQIPKAVLLKMKQDPDETLGKVASEYYGVDNLGDKQGLIGVMTGEAVTRTEVYVSITRILLGLYLLEVEKGAKTDAETEVVLGTPPSELTGLRG